MFLRKLLVIVVPLVLCGLCVFFLPLLGGFGLWSDLLQGLILGALLALLLPLSGASSRRKEPFATLLVVPMIVLIVPAGAAAHARARRGAAVPARERLHDDD